MRKAENRFPDRASAGLLLANQINLDTCGDAEIVAIPHGGIPIAAPISRALRVPAKVCLTTRITLSDYPELSVGSMSRSGEVYLDPQVLGFLAPSDQDVASALEACRMKLSRLTTDLSPWAIDSGLEGKNVLLVDDVIATGTSVLGAVQFVAGFKPRSVCVACPVISRYAAALLTERQIQFTVVTLSTASQFSPRNHYDDFTEIDGPNAVNTLRSLSKIHAKATQSTRHRGAR